MQIKFTRWYEQDFSSTASILLTADEAQTFERIDMWGTNIYELSGEAVPVNENRYTNGFEVWNFREIGGTLTYTNADLDLVAGFERIIKKACQRALAYCTIAEKFMTTPQGAEVTDVTATDEDGIAALAAMGEAPTR
ncbi:MAG TPA: hypothetical protein VGC56_15415 [Allosphingosinicella sp.]|jgi:hypothetical protein